MSNSHTQHTNQPIRLQNAQSALRDAYFSHESGLFTLPCVAGAGKSTANFRITAEDLLRRYVDGDATPEQHIAVISFNSDEAAKIIPEISDHLRTIVEHDLRPVASAVTEQEVEHLIQRVYQAPFIGTIDSLLRNVFQQFAVDIGFDEMPAVGNDALLARIHADCYETLKTNPSYSDEVAALEAAYPDGERDDSPAEMLESAVKYCRNRQLSTAAFREKLEQTRQAVYEEQPGEFDAIVAAVERVVGDDSIGTTVREHVDTTDDRARLAKADERLYQEWGDRIDDFCSVFAAYRAAYRERTREYGAVSHTDVAFLVASYLDETLSSFTGIDGSADLRQRILQRYHGRLQSLIIDEAQDVSEIQHTALSQLVHPGMRVCASGDILQSIYQWRHANPELFESAVANGEYLGINWATHKNEPATTTYRCVPDIAQAINNIVEPMFADTARGSIGTIDTTRAYNVLTAAREVRDEPAVHISGFGGGPNPGSPPWVHPENGTGEADRLATHLSKGLADGTFTDADGDPLNITVLFRRKTRMGEYEDAFEDAGLRVRNANSTLFSSPAVKLVLRVCDWLVAPEVPDQTKQLVTEGSLGLSSLADEFETAGWDIDAMLASDAPSTDQTSVLAGLQKLRDQRSDCERLPASVYIENIIEQLRLRADAHNLCPETDARQRVANLDGFVDMVTQWETDDQYNPAELTDLVEPFREKPTDGPAQPGTTTSTYDVEFRTVHQAKGDEDDIVAIADLGYNAGLSGTQCTRLIRHGSIAGLAPPTNVDIPTEIDIPPLQHGLYDPSAEYTRDIGLRWATTRWTDSVTAVAQDDELVSPALLQHVIQSKRAELWRLLYVALTRARDHLVMPLPDDLQYDMARDRLIESLRRGLEYAGDRETYELSTAQGEITIGVNDADIHASRATKQTDPPDPVVITTPPEPGALDPWIPRFLNSSEFLQLTDNPTEHAVAHLLGESIHTESNNASQKLQLPFATLGPDEIGSVIHDTLTNLISKGVSEAKLIGRDDAVSRVFDDTVYGAAPALDDDDRDKLWDFFTDIVDEFIDSELWEQIQAADSVRVEKPINGVVTTDAVEVEVHGQVDIVIDLPSGKRVVSDLKIALADPTEATQARYNLQVSSYAYLFGQQSEASQSVQPKITTFGVNTKTMTASGWARLIERQIRNLID